MAGVVALLSRAASALAWFFVPYAGAVVVFYVLSGVWERAGFVARCLASWLALVVCALYGVGAAILLRLAGSGRYQQAQWATARAFKYTMAVAAGVTFVVDDPRSVLARTRPAVFVSNHQSALDVAMLGSTFPQYCSMTGKSSLRHYPFLGWFMSLSGAIFLDRGNRRDARSAMQGAATAIRSRRQSVYMFPEGTRSHSIEPTLLPFKKGAFHLAVQAGVPIVPIVVANYSHIYATSLFRFRAGAIPVRVLDPIPTTGLTADDVTDLTNRTRDLMLREITTLTAQARGTSVAAPTAMPVVAAAEPASSAPKAANHAVSTGVEAAAS